MDNENRFQKVDLNEDDYKGTVKFASRVKKLGRGAVAAVIWLVNGDNLEKAGNALYKLLESTSKALDSVSNNMSKNTKK